MKSILFPLFLIFMIDKSVPGQNPGHAFGVLKIKADIRNPLYHLLDLTKSLFLPCRDLTVLHYNVSHHISLYFPVSLSYSSTGIFPLRQVVPSR